MGNGNGVSVDGGYGRRRMTVLAKGFMRSGRACVMGATLLAFTSACAGTQSLEDTSATPTAIGPNHGSWFRQLIDLESQAAAPESQPKSAEDAQALIDSLADLIQRMSPSDEAQHYPRLASLRWRAFVFEALHHNTVEGVASCKELPDPFALRLRSLRDAHPSPLSTDKKHPDAPLLQKLAALADTIDDRDVKGLLEKAKGVLAIPPDTQDDCVPLHELFGLLDYYESVRGASDPTIGELRDRVGDLAMNQDSREYQTWAVGEIQAFNTKMKKAKGWDEDGGWSDFLDQVMWSADEASLVSELMAERLLRIDPRHLETPVLNLYRDALDSGWAVLKKHADNLLTCVAVTSALMPKRQLGQPVPARPAKALLRQNNQWAQSCP